MIRSFSLTYFARPMPPHLIIIIRKPGLGEFHLAGRNEFILNGFVSFSFWLLASSSWWRIPNTALPYWRLDAKHPCPLPSSKPCGPPKFWGWTSSSITLSQVNLGRPGGLRQSGGGRSAAAMTRWWSSSGADRARCPKKPQPERLDFFTDGQAARDAPDCVICSVPE